MKSKLPGLCMALVALVTVAGTASAQSFVPNTWPKAAASAGMAEPRRSAVRPLHSSQCEYKAVMNYEDMRHCGVFYYSDPGPVVPLVRVEPRRSR